MSNLTRYDCVVSFDKSMVGSPMQKREHGEFVKFVDVEEAKILQSGEAPVQQLKAEIRSVVGILNATKNSNQPGDIEWCVNKLRELSAV